MLAHAFPLAAQVPDSIEVTSDYYRTFTEADLFTGIKPQYKPLDTLISNFHIYNPVIKAFNINTTTGNLGHPYRSPIGSPYRTLGFDIGMHQLDIWAQRKEDALFYRSRAPFIEASYFNGSKREQLFFVNANQNITRNWNMGLKYERLTSDGFYTNQYTNNTNWHLYSSYLSKDERYRFAFTGGRSNLSARVNGGLVDINTFKDNIETNRLLLDVNLSGARHSWHKRYAHFQQAFDLAKKKPEPDSVLEKQSTVRTFSDKVVRLYHMFDLEDMALMYLDTLPAVDSFYNALLFDSTATIDRTNHTLIENRLGVKFLVEQAKGDLLWIDAYAGHQYIHYNSNTIGQTALQNIDGKSNNLYIGGNVRLPVFKGWGFQGNATVFLAGYNIGDYEGRFSIFHTETDTTGNQRSRVEVGLMVKAYEPSYLQSRYTSNFFVWDNNFKKTFANTLFAGYTSRRLKLEVNLWVTDMRQYIYFNQVALPQQANTGVTVFAGQLVKRFNVKNKWNFDAYVTGQVTTSDLLPLPNLVLRSSIYYKNYIFKKALLLAVGFDVFYNTAYKAPAYMPATGVFYIQSQTSVGNYPYIDVFINAQIKKARIFFKIEHLTSGLLGQNYLQYPNLPMNDRAFKLGINWRFYN